jgi:carbon starvation protein CstA
MYSFFISLCILVAGYFLYGRFISRVFGPDEKRPTPCYTQADGVDYIPMPTWKVFMIQFLNIAGLGPIFGAIMGAKFGTAAYLWIVLGTIFAGAVHDYLSAMISLREGGASLPEIIGKYLGQNTRRVMCVFTVVLMILVGAVFVSGPAELLAGWTPDWCNAYVWIVIIFAYYILATLLPVDRIIGRVYPFFAACLLFMAVGILGYLLVVRPELPELWDSPCFGIKYETNPVFPMMFISIACGAISGFHATQSPLMARCLKNERLGRPCFYGAMVTEGIVALIWAAAATCFFHENGVADAGGVSYSGAKVATLISTNWLGLAGGLLAIIGIAVAPITSGDTALRSGRLIVADFLHVEQRSMRRRLYISVPMFVVTAGILIWSLGDKNGFNILWRYFAWCNQALSVFTLWAVTVFLMRTGRLFWVTFFPAMFMTAVCTSYILVAPEGLALNYALGVSVGVVVALVTGAAFLVRHYRGRHASAPDNA